MARRVLFLAGVCLAALTVIGCEAGSVFGASLVDVSPAPPSEVQSASLVLVDAYVEAVGKHVGPLPASPRLSIRNSPYLAYYDREAREIVLPYWPPAKVSTRDFFIAIADGSEAKAVELFERLFHEFLLVHELTHWLQDVLGLSLDHYTSETMANDVAVAFLMLHEGRDARLMSLDGLLADALEHLVDPTPAGLNARTFFNAFYRVLVQDPSKYGYFQFRFIRDSISRRDDLDLESLLAVR